MKRTCARLLLLSLLLVLAGCGSNSDPTRSIDFIPLRTIVITSQNDHPAPGTKNQFTAIGHYGDPATFQFTRDITKQVTWSSSDPALLAFSDPAAVGLATAVAAGTATVTARLGEVFTDFPATVSNETITALSITPSAPTTLFVDQTKQLVATGTFTDNTSQDLTESVAWLSSTITVATVSDTVPGKGLVKALDVGKTDITATFGGQTATLPLEVAAVSLASIAVTQPEGKTTLAKGTSLLFTATGTYTDASTKPLTNVTWASSDAAVATIGQAGTYGKLTSVSAGTTTVTASLNTITSDGLVMTVSSATLTSLAVTPTTQTINIGNTVQMKATGTFSDSSTQDVTRDVGWGTSNDAIATIDISPGKEGTVTGITRGTVTISATNQNIPTTGGVNPANAQVTVQ